jgi:DNA invertase Pin-like site-specific DNA recombinase
MKKAIALLRVSTEAQAEPEREGLPAQRRTCEQVARAQGLTIIDSVELRGVSGAAVLEDPRFRNLLDRLASPGIAGVVVADFDRLFRRGRFADYAILDAFAETRSKLYASDGVYDPAEDTGGLLGVLRGELAGMERRQIAERTRRGREEKRRRTGGRAEGLVGVPRGVCFDLRSALWSYAEPEASRVRKVFDLFLHDDLALAEIARRCELWGAGAVRSILEQHLYRGVYKVDRRWTKGRSDPRPPEECYEHRVIKPGIVTDREFDRAQAKLAERRARRPQQRHDPETMEAIYVGHLVCAAKGCGCRVVTVHDSNGYGGYRCAGALRRKCREGAISSRKADPQLDAALEAMLGDPGRLRELLEASLAAAERHEGIDGPGIERRLIALDGRRSRAQDAYLDGFFDLPKLGKKIEVIEAERIRLHDLMAELGREEEIEPEALAEIATTFATWTFLTRTHKRRLLHAYGAKIAVLRPTRGVIQVVRVNLQSVAIEWIYKKMKRFGIE